MSTEQRPVFLSNLFPEWADSDQWATPAAALAAQRWAKVGPLVCAQCGTTYQGKIAQQGRRYCSPKCRQKAWRKRQA